MIINQALTNMEVIDINNALKKGLRYYFTGKECGRGHIAERFVSTRTCKICSNINLKNNRKQNPERTKLQKKKDGRKYYQKNKEIINEKNKLYYLKNLRKIKTYNKNYHKSYYQKNKEIINERNKIYVLNNKEKVNKRHNKYRRKKRIKDINFRVADNLRRRINQSLRNFKNEKSLNSKKLVGCSIEDLRFHLQKNWLPGMSWENYGYYGWHIDHIIPCSKFDLSKLEEQKKCFHFTNLQPLWALDNIKKSNKLNYERRYYVKEKKAS